MPAQPEYVRIAARLREDIASGRRPLGSQLPGEQELAADLGVSRETTRRALQILRTEGTIVTEQGKGSRVVSVPAVITIRIGPDDWVITRVPDEAERLALGFSPGVPVFEVFRGGAGGEVHDGSVTRISAEH